MTKRKRLKRLVRARAAKTGESYTAARRHFQIDPLEEPHMSSTDADIIARCSFCTKTNKEVTKLVAGPGVYICDECITLCNDIIANEGDAPPKKTDLGYAFADWSDFMLLSLLPGIARTARDVVDDLNAQVRRLRDRGVGWEQIGEALGITGSEAEIRFEPAP
jgi:hypothetical protein